MSLAAKKGTALAILSCLAAGGAVVGLHARQEPAAKHVLKAAFAGSWYSADANELRRDIAGYLDKAQVEPQTDVVALVLPHAGYAYSAPTAAYGIKSLGRSYKRVVVIGPTHRLPMEDLFSVPRETHFETPLGQRLVE